MIVDSVLAPAGDRRPVGAASMTSIGNFFLAAAPIHPGRDHATPTTLFEIDGATQVWHSSARYAQFRAPAFPSSLPCRSRCRALAGLVRAQTSDDIRPRALCTPPPKSFARSPGPLHPANAATGITVWSASFAPGVHFETNSDLCATAYCAAGPRSLSRAIAGWISYDFEARSTSPNGEKGPWHVGPSFGQCAPRRPNGDLQVARLHARNCRPTWQCRLRPMHRSDTVRRR